MGCPLEPLYRSSQQGSFGVVGLLTWLLASLTVTVPRVPDESYMTFSDTAQKPHRVTLTEAITSPLRFNGKGHRLQFLMGGV